MGISANQARLLALTARKCDLETQMQVILNNKVNIAKETSNIANTYNDAISNRKLFIFRPTTNATLADKAGSQSSIYQQIEPKNLYNTGGLLVAHKTSVSTANPSGYEQIKVSDPALIEQGLREGTFFLVKAATLQTQDPKTISFDANYGGTPNSVLQGVPQDDATKTNITSWEIVNWRDSTQVTDQLDTSDDQTAQANYEATMKQLDAKESKLDVEMNSIETAHSAITNEIESVKKIMTKNTEDSFKYFS